MGYDDDRKPGLGSRQPAEKALQRLDAAGGSADADNRKGRIVHRVVDLVAAPATSMGGTNYPVSVCVISIRVKEAIYGDYSEPKLCAGTFSGLALSAGTQDRLPGQP